MVVMFRSKMHILSLNWSQQLCFCRRHHSEWTFFVLATFETQTLIFHNDLIHEKKCYYHFKCGILHCLCLCFLSLSAFAIRILYSPVKLYCLAAHWAFETSYYKIWTLPSQEPPSMVGNGSFATCLLLASLPHLSSLRISQLELCKLLY